MVQPTTGGLLHTKKGDVRYMGAKHQQRVGNGNAKRERHATQGHDKLATAHVEHSRGSAMRTGT